MADNDDLFDGTIADDGATGSGDGDPTPPATQGDGSDAAKSNSSTEDKGVAFWMSKAQAAEAALRKAQGLDSKGQPKADAKPDPKSADAAPEPTARESEYAAYLKEAALERLFNEEPRLKDFGYSLEDISGDSLEEMKANRNRLVKVIDRAESRALNRAFEQVGIDPALAGGPTEKRDFAAMTDEEIEKEIARAKGLS